MRKLLLTTIFISNLTVCFCQTATDSTFFAFIGEKISVKYAAPDKNSNQIEFDRKYIARYKVLKPIYGNYKNDTIEFEVYIHLGDSPAFSAYKNVELYLSRYGSKWYHEKYQFDPVYRTVDGRWAGVGRSDDYGHSYNKNTSLKPEKIVFDTAVSFDISRLSRDQIDYFYPNKYFIYKDNKAFPAEGNYAEDLFLLKKEWCSKSQRCILNHALKAMLVTNSLRLTAH